MTLGSAARAVPDTTRRTDTPSSTTGVEDHAIAARIRAGDAAAFDALVVTYFDRLERFARFVLGNDHGSEDVVQEVLARLWRGRGSWVLTTSLATYLFTAVRNEALNRLRHERVALRVTDMVHRQLEIDRETAESRGSADAFASRVDLAALLNRLPPRRRQALVLRYAEGLPYAKIAEILGSSTKGVEQLVMRTLKTLREYLEPPPRPARADHPASSGRAS